MFREFCFTPKLSPNPVILRKFQMRIRVSLGAQLNCNSERSLVLAQSVHLLTGKALPDLYLTFLTITIQYFLPSRL